MFEAVFEIFAAWNALLYLTGGAIVSGIGVLILAYAAYVRITETSYRAQIVGVRTDEGGAKTYWPLIAYTDEKGVRREVVANAGSSAILGRAPGTKVTVFASPKAPEAVMLKGDWWFLVVFGLIFAAVGAPFLAVGFAMLHWTRGTALVVLALAGYGGWKASGLVPLVLAARKNGWAETRKAFLERRSRAKHQVVVSDADIAAAVAAQTKQSAYAVPVLMLIGAGLLIAGAFWFKSSASFMQTALAAQGVVLRNEESNSSDSSPSYHAVVEFTDQSGNRVTYRDSVGTSPPTYSTGDKVHVLYAPGDAKNAMIDRGVWNWFVPLAIATFGALLLSIGAYSALNRSVRSSTTPAPRPDGIFTSR